MKSTRLWLGSILVLYVVFAIAYNVVTPAASTYQHNPDENDHTKYVSVLASGHLPVFTSAPAGSEFHQPPLYYLFCTPVYLATHAQGDATSIKAMRVVSTVFGLFLILAAYRCVRRLFPDEPWVALLTAGFVGLLPMNIATDASVGNDSLTNLLVAVGLALTARIAVSEADDVRAITRGAVQLGVVMGLIIWTKSSGLVLFPAVFVAWALLVFTKRLPAPSIVRGGAITFGPALLIGAPWLIRNAMIYGDPLGQKLFLKSFTGTTMMASQMTVIAGGPGSYTVLVEKWTFASFWGVFDSMTAFWGRDPHVVYSHYPPFGPIGPSIDAPLAPVYQLLLALMVIAVVGLLLYFRSKKLSTPQLVMCGAMALLLVGTAIGFRAFILTFFQAQGRYWFTALVPLALFFALGYRGIFAKENVFRVVSILLILGLVALNAYTIWGLLIPRFAA